jgi:hypothetical protein
MDGDPTLADPTIFNGHDSVVLSTGQSVDLYTVKENGEIEGWHVPVRCGVLATWVTTEDVRGVMCGLRGLNSSEVSMILEGYISNSQ